MPRLFHPFVLLLILMLMVACSPVTLPAEPDKIEQTEANDEAFLMRDLGVRLSNPLSLIYGPDDMLWITERTGKRVVRVNPVDGAVQVLLELPDAYQSENQDGVLGMVLHPEFLQGTGNDFVYLAYVYQGEGMIGRQVNRQAKIVRYTYDAATAALVEPWALMTDLPGSYDHNSGKLLIGADGKLYYTIGDQGNNQFSRLCLPILAQALPTAAEVEASDWSHYQGKVLRMNLDGSIPADNPTINGVQSHVFTYGHRNAQGIVMSGAGVLYATEHGPKSDDEVNLLEAGYNYGWPHVAGYQDDQAYVYVNWAAAPDCAQLNPYAPEIPASVPQQAESAWDAPNFMPPLLTFGTVPNDYHFQRAECAPNEWMCWPSIAPTGLTFYGVYDDGVPGWDDSLLATALKTGTVYRMVLSDDGRAIVGDAVPLFATINRYRDIAVAPDGRTFYVITDSENWTQGSDGLPTLALENPGAILVFTYTDGD